MPRSLDAARISNLSVTEIRARAAIADPTPEMIARLAGDPRAGVRAIADSLARRMAKTERRRHHAESLVALERELAATGYTAVAGVDEAGRGPLAGPVVAAAVILPADYLPEGLDDSKKLTAPMRETLYASITFHALAWGTGLCGHDEIDAVGILRAAMRAMRQAVEALGIPPDLALVDGNQSPRLACPERLIVEGDGRCRSIAAASVIAKVTRDRLMREMDVRYPGYGFARHKGYGCETHLGALRRHGPCDIHRFSFSAVTRESPAGRCRDILARRFADASSPEALAFAAEGVARLGDTLPPDTVEILREAYRAARTRFTAERSSR